MAVKAPRYSVWARSEVVGLTIRMRTDCRARAIRVAQDYADRNVSVVAYDHDSYSNGHTQVIFRDGIGAELTDYGQPK